MLDPHSLFPFVIVRRKEWILKGGSPLIEHCIPLNIYPNLVKMVRMIKMVKKVNLVNLVKMVKMIKMVKMVKMVMVKMASGNGGSGLWASS